MRIKELIKQCLTPTDSPSDERIMSKATMIVSAVLAAVCSVTSTMNLIKGYRVMAATTIILVIGFVASAFLCRANKRNIAVIICDFMIVFLFSYYAVSGGNQGFAILWMLLAPIMCMGFFGLSIGILTSLYFQIFLIILFYTPLKEHIQGYYTNTFLMRFPVLFFADFAGTAVFMAQRHIMQLHQLTAENNLKAAVEAERERVSAISMQTILSISNAVDAKDKYTQAHSERVADYSVMIAKELGWSDEQIEELRQIALLHDIGKIAVSDAILNKEGKLTNEEYEIMKTHTTAGGKILRDLTILKNVSLGAMHHHERYDGKGYPNGLAGSDIPIEARIIGIADAFDAMNSNRVYRAKLTPQIIYDELVKGRGTQFDPELVDLFLPIADKLLFEG